MPLEWTHEKCGKRRCTGTTGCPAFPTLKDRIHMAQAVYGEYAETDGTTLIDFALDVLLLAQSHYPADETFLTRLATEARKERMTYRANTSEVPP